MRQTSGASTIGDWPVSGSRVDSKTYSDVKDDVFAIEKEFEKEEPGWSPVRTVNQFVVVTGEKLGVKTYIVVPPLICSSFPLPNSKLPIQIRALDTNMLEILQSGQEPVPLPSDSDRST